MKRSTRTATPRRAAVAKKPVKKAGQKKAQAGRRKKGPTSTFAGHYRQSGVATVRGKAELKYLKWTDVELEELNPSLTRQFIVGRDIMIARVLIKKGGIVPEHSHVNEQVTYILEGALKFTIDGRDIVVHAGEVLTIPSNMPHRAEAMEDTVDLDVFNPPRADWINKDDSYLRASVSKQ